MPQEYTIVAVPAIGCLHGRKNRQLREERKKQRFCLCGENTLHSSYTDKNTRKYNNKINLL